MKSLAAVLLLCLSHPSQAQQVGTINFGASNSLSMSLGMNQPLTIIHGVNDDKDGSAGVAVGGELMHQLNSYFSLGLGIDYLQRTLRNSTLLIPNIYTSVSGDNVSALALGKLSIIPEGRFHPYVALGLGVGKNSEKVTAFPLPSFAWAATGTTDKRTLVDSSDTGFTFAIRGGADANLSDSISIGAELGYQKMQSLMYSLTPAGNQVLPGISGFGGAEGNLTFMGRISFLFTMNGLPSKKLTMTHPYLGLSAAVSSDTEVLKSKHYARIAILPFKTSRGDDQSIADALTPEFMKAGFTVIERNQLASVFQELRLSYTGTISSESIKQVGKLAQVDALVIGSMDVVPYRSSDAISYGNDGVAGFIARFVSLRMVDIETGKVVLSSTFKNGDTRATYVPTSNIPSMMMQDVRSRMGQSDSESKPNDVTSSQVSASTNSSENKDAPKHSCPEGESWRFEQCYPIKPIFGGSK